MRIAWEFKVSPEEVLGWNPTLFDYACAYISMRDEAEQKRVDEMKSTQSGHKTPTMRGGRR